MDPANFDAAKARDNLVNEIRKLARAQGFSRVVLGISGGKDSTVCAALCARALGAENVYGVMLPDGEQADIADSRSVCEALHINARTVNIGEMHASLKRATDQLGPVNREGEFSVPYSRASDINVGPRLRMTTLRYIAQALGARLVGTGNLSEATVGYCTKDGDTSCDFALLGKLTSLEVVQVGLAMPELPRELVEKTPTDGLSGKSDEDNMGLKYADIHAWIREGSCGDPEVDQRIAARERANRHKRAMPVVLDPFKTEE
ncbi:MAG: NAD(+) synthase [Clostridiales bacterium]|nr:NAD(+) synthase [Clostridiales bacterium]